MRKVSVMSGNTMSCGCSRKKGISPNPVKKLEFDNDKIKEMRDKKMSNKAIAEELGIKVRSFNYYIYKMNSQGVYL